MALADNPVIGITSYVEPASWGAWTDVAASLVPHAYVAQVQRAGGIAVLVPPLGAPDAGLDDARTLLASLDGLILAGGADVDSAAYGQAPHQLAQESRPDRDSSEMLLATAARGLIPVLGICRGMQVMVVAAGGQLEQHLPDRLDSLEHSPAPGTYGSRTVETLRESGLRSIIGPTVEVNCYHHQGVQTHPGFAVTALSTDGVIEAVEAVEPDGSTTAPLYFGVQWHPETGTDVRLFQALVDAAR